MSSSARDTAIKSLEGRRLARIMGRPTMKIVNQTRNEIASEYAKAKTSHPSFPQGTRFGFASAILKKEKFRSLHNAVAGVAVGDELTAAWVFAYPTRPESYDETIAGNMLDATRRKREAARADLITQFDIFEGYKTSFKDKVEEAYDQAYFTTMKDDVLGFMHVTVADMLQHLEGQCHALTEREKKEKLQEVNVPWDQNDDIQTYFVKLDKLEEELKNEFDIEWPTSMKIMQAVNEMYDSNQFSEKDMMDWEDKPAPDKTWVHLQTYYNALWTKKQRYGGTSPRNHGYESAANVSEVTDSSDARMATNLMEVARAATADKEHIQQMSDTADDLLTIVKKQQNQIDELIKQNGQLTSALSAHKPTTIPKNRERDRERGRKDHRASREKAEVAKEDRRASKERAEPPKDSSGCAVCGRQHETAKCWELDKNKATRPDWWKSYFE